MKDNVRDLYKKLSENIGETLNYFTMIILYKKLSENIGETPELFHYDYFKLKGGELYYIGNRKPLRTEGKLKSVGTLADILGKNRLHRLGFNIPVVA